MDKYLQYDHLELSEEPSFIRWAKGSKPRNGDDWDAWLSMHPEMTEKVEQAKSIVVAMKFVEDRPSKETENKVWSSISKEINAEKSTLNTSRVSRRRIIQMIAYGAAAAIALVFIFRNIGSDFDTEINVPFAKTETINLPDGSIVTINAGSTIAYDKASWKENRVVSLRGEAFFEVEKGSTFTVDTRNGSVEVLGTSFNVYHRKHEFKVHCETGKVSVKAAGKETILVPDQSVAVVNSEHIFEEKVSESEMRSTWRKGVFVYNGAELEDVIEELERQFDVEFSTNLTDVKQRYSGSFRNSDLETALTEVLYPLGLTFTVDGNKVVVRK